MQYRFSQAISNTPKSFIREILKLTQSDEIISFAGGLPNKDFFPVKAIAQAAQVALTQNGESTLQYGMTEGYTPLREWIVKRYQDKGVNINKDNVLVVSGSQQALDLLGKVFLDIGDVVALEKPSYLGAIQAFQMFQPQFEEVTLDESGVNLAQLANVMQTSQAKFFYGIPNFQNPTGLTYSLEHRQALAQYLIDNNQLMVEDDPYGELRFIGETLPSVYSLAPDNVILLGSFSKVCAPGMRIGWVVANNEIINQLVTAKQASDLHTSILSQRVLFEYLQANSLDEHIEKIRTGYKAQRMAMVNALKEYMPEGISFTEPEGGMFLWVTLPENCSALDLMPIAIKHQVAFVPGDPFSTVEGGAKRHMRLSYCTVDSEKIVEGIKRLAAAIHEYQNR